MFQHVYGMDKPRYPKTTGLPVNIILWSATGWHIIPMQLDFTTSTVAMSTPLLVEFGDVEFRVFFTASIEVVSEYFL